MIALVFMWLFALVATWALTGVVRRHALAAQRLDIPNARSSHSQPTPRGGGLAFVLTFVSLYLIVAATQGAAWEQTSLLVPPMVVAIIGYLDDTRPVGARWRFLIHAMAAAWALWLMGGIPPVPVLGERINLSWFGPVLAAVYLIWMTNLFNFMDGIDAIAAIEGTIVSAGGALCWWLATDTTQWPILIAFSACLCGFLRWNFPPARIFMGDVGSGFIGIVIGIASLWTAQHETQVFWSWFILLGCFMVDATTTLVRRVRRGEKFHEAHRCHAYQFAARRHRSHKSVSLAYGAITLCWLLPVAVLVALRLLDGVLGVLLAYAPLVALAFRYQAGNRCSQEATLHEMPD